MGKRNKIVMRKGCSLIFVVTVIILMVAMVVPLFSDVSAISIQTTPKVTMLPAVTKDRPSPFGETWSAQLNIDESYKGTNDFAVFGEATDASDNQDTYDTPKPGFPPSPFVYAYFKTTLTSPYDVLMKEFRHYPETNEKIWTLFIICNLGGPSFATTDITISWDKTKIDDSEYGYVELFHNGSQVANMLTDSGYTYYNAGSMYPYYFYVKGRVNYAPVINAGNDASINEGDTFSQSGSFADTGSYSWTANVSYGDGSATEILTLNPDKSFSLSHLYVDNGVYTATVKVKDDLGTVGTDTVIVTVNNVAPTGTLGNDGPKNEGSLVTVSFTGVVDPGTLDTFVYSFDWENDGTYDVVDQGGASATHTWADNGVYTVKARVKDDDGGFSEYTTGVTVNNVAPTVDTGLDKTIYQGETFTTWGSFTDPGADIWTATVDYGDGTGTNPLTLNSNKTFYLNHLYTTGGTYTVTVTVNDDDSGIGTDTATITVLQFHTITVSRYWNLISIPCYDTISKTDIKVRHLGTDYTWSQAVSAGYILDTLYGWNGIAYTIETSLVHGKGYWFYAFNNDCQLLIYSNAVGTGHIADLPSKWSIIGLPYESSINTIDLHFEYLSGTHTWQEAINDGYILGFVYGWDRTSQIYTLVTQLQPGYGYWMYAYLACTMKQ